MTIGAVRFTDKKLQTCNFIWREDIICRRIIVEEGFHILVKTRSPGLS